MDGSTDMVQAARKRLKGLHAVDIRRGDMEALPIDDGQLDVAIAALVLHHLPEPQRALAEAARTLKPHGRLLVLDMSTHEREEYRQSMGHVWLGFSEKQMSSWLRGAGFRDIHWRLLPPDPKTKGPTLFVVTARKIS